MTKSVKRQFYFSLFRLIALLRGGDSRRAENNGVEALLVGLMIYLIHYLFFASRFFSFDFKPWVAGLFLVALAFGIWLFWLLFLYFNSLIIKLLRVSELFHAIPTRRAQSILWGIVTTAMAYALLDGSRLLHEVAAVWLMAVAMNLAAAMVLAFSNATRNAGD